MQHGESVIQHPMIKNFAPSLQENVVTVFQPHLDNSLLKYLTGINSGKTENKNWSSTNF